MYIYITYKHTYKVSKGHKEVKFRVIFHTSAFIDVVIGHRGLNIAIK